jgi:acyl dehydratase
LLDVFNEFFCGASIGLMDDAGLPSTWVDAIEVHLHWSLTMTLLVVARPSDLKQHLNIEVGPTDYLVVDQERVARFAEAVEDRQWIHTDVERAARESPFKATVAHGFLVLSLLSHFVTTVVDVQGAQMIVNCGLNSVRFLDPVLAGSRLRGRMRLKECADGPGFVQATWRVTVECEGGRFPACTANWLIRYYT